jgi:phosphatidylinositol alpha 1,6-mannosyltransferase
MAHPRVHRLFTARQTAQGDAVFGVTQLVDERVSRAPVQRVAVLAEAFLPKIDGVSRTAYLTVRYLQETGREVLIFAPDSAVPAVGQSEVVALPSVSMPRAEETRAALPSLTIARRISEFRPDAVMMFSPAIMSVTGMAMARHLKIPAIAVYQTDLPGYMEHYGFPLFASPVRRWLRYIHNGCHLTLAPSRKVRDELRAYHFKRLRLWGRGVDIDLYQPAKRTADMRARLLGGRDEKSLLCVYVGRLANEKCVHMLRQVAATPGVALTIVGDGTLREELEQQFAGTGTVFTGYMVGDELAQAFASADVFFFPGAQETFGQVVQEAMASGLPSVVTNRGGVSGLVEDGITGIICDHDEAAFARAAITLRDNPALRQQMSLTARQLAEQRPWSAVMGQLEDYLTEAYLMNQRFGHRFGYTNYHDLLSLPTRLLW